jgi:hypothetical protein
MAMRMETANLQALQVIAKRVKKIGTLSPSDVYQLELLRNIGADVLEMESYLAEATALNIRDIDKVYKTQAKKLYKEQGKFYKAKGIDQVALEKNTIMQGIIKSQANRTKNTFRNLSHSQVISFKDKRGRVIHKSIRKAYQDVVDEAITLVQSGAVNYTQAIQSSVDRIADSGIRYLNYASGRSVNLYSATRMNIMEGMRTLSRDMRDQAGREFGADGWEIDAHALCAEDHLEIQGKQYTNEEFDELNAELDRPIGEMNCQHSAFPIVIGVSEPIYDQDTLDEFAENTLNKDIQIGDTKYSKYECSQLQRKIELNIRQSKIKKAVEEAGGLDTSKSNKRLKMLNNKYGEVSKKAKLVKRPENLRVPKNLLR